MISLVSFDVFGTLINMREGSYAAFASILRASGAAQVDVQAFWEYREGRNMRSTIAHHRSAARRSWLEVADSRGKSRSPLLLTLLCDRVPA